MNIKTIKNLDYSNYQNQIIKFLNDNNQYTIFHDPRFLSYHKYSDKPIQDYKFKDILIEDNGNILMYFPGGIDTNNHAFISHKGGSFSGPIFNRHLAIFKKITLLQEAINYIQTFNIKKIIIKQTPSFYLPHPVFNNELEWVLYQLSFSVSSYDLTTILMPINNDADFKKMSRNVKRNYTVASSQDLVIDTKGDLKTFYQILKKNREKFHDIPTHTLKDLTFIQKNCPNQLSIHLLYFKTVPIAGLCLFHVSKDVSNIFYMCHLDEYSYLKPCNYLIVKLQYDMFKIGKKFMDFGPSNFNKEIKESLLKFKLGFNGTIQLRRHYEKVF